MAQSRVIVSEQLDNIFKMYRVLMLNKNYIPKTPEETLYARLTATFYLSNWAKLEEYFHASELIRRTSPANSRDQDHNRLKLLSMDVVAWSAIEICKADQHSFCEYKLLVETKTGKKIIHQRARYHTENNGCIFISQIPVQPIEPMLMRIYLGRSGIEAEYKQPPLQPQPVAHVVDTELRAKL